ncbi:hypothetical protein H634G_03188 [Metarhizium anisopliae BRIP 53293]|uniref:Uncharacterized protein n=1 Tax=Metarhizium anisopliae BRIP 53293 TaxID=1291518 RepID=A0A0D9PAU3_METAN|nr:hypothetical protein H634G_03188 [Metarhizium anisopliae BRIP 53293]KJK86769.1 hypothetical protein H633G_09375 [Metarhizium anisopliae BRIP 53284]
MAASVTAGDLETTPAAHPPLPSSRKLSRSKSCRDGLTEASAPVEKLHSDPGDGHHTFYPGNRPL